MRKLAGNQFFASTMLVGRTGKETVAGPFANAENVTHWLDAMIAELTWCRDQVAGGDAGELTQRVDKGLAEGYAWLNATYTGNWDAGPSTMAEVPSAGQSFRELFFGRLRMPDRAKQAEQAKRK
jgi:hypothetical protein